MYKSRITLALSTTEDLQFNNAQFIHKVFLYFSTFFYPRSIAFMHLSTYTTTATI